MNDVAEKMQTRANTCKINVPEMPINVEFGTHVTKTFYVLFCKYSYIWKADVVARSGKVEAYERGEEAD